MKYKITEEGVLRSDGAGIPNSPLNRDWVQYLEWVKAGGVPIERDAPMPPDFFERKPA